MIALRGALFVVIVLVVVLVLVLETRDRKCSAEYEDENECEPEDELTPKTRNPQRENIIAIQLHIDYQREP
jgi:hypothetical protein